MLIGGPPKLRRPAPTPAALALLLLLFMAAPVFGLEGTININQAGVEELQELPFVGQGRAQAIVNFRQENGAFTSLDELRQIPDIGQSTYEAIKPYLSLSGASTLKEDEEEESPSSTQVFPLVHTSPGQIIMLPDDLYYQTLTSFIRQAEKSILLTTFLFKTTSSPKNMPSLLIKELAAARKKGVQVRVVLEKSGYDENINKENESTARKLSRQQITVEFDSEKRTNHAKIVVIDKRFSFIGSHNLTHSALSRNHEYSLVIDSEPLARELASYINGI